MLKKARTVKIDVNAFASHASSIARNAIMVAAPTATVHGVNVTTGRISPSGSALCTN